jgi:hypothetical protein
MDKHMTLDIHGGAMLCSDCMHDGYDSEIRLYCCSDCHRDGCEHCVKMVDETHDVAKCTHFAGCMRAMLGEVVSFQEAGMEDGPDPGDRF